MHTTLPRSFLALAALLMLAACGDDSHSGHMAGTPDHWWSGDNYIAMLQDAESVTMAAPVQKPVRLKLF